MHVLGVSVYACCPRRGLSKGRVQSRDARKSVVVRAERQESRTKATKGVIKKATPTKSTASCNATAAPDTAKLIPKKSKSDTSSIFNLFKTVLEHSGLRNVDGSIILGDASMIFCTHLASEDLHYGSTGTLAFISLGCWIGISALRGDYSYSAQRKRGEAGGMMALMPGYSSFLAIQESIFSWLFFTPVVLCALASLIAHGIIDPNPVMHVLPGAKVAPELEVIVALSLTMPCWRGFYYAVRDGVL